MTHFEDFDVKYASILRKIDQLRAQGVSDTNIEMMRAKVALRDILELKKRNSTAIQKVVPRLTGIKTVTITNKTFGDLKERIHNKYVMLGVAVGVCALIYFYLMHGSEDRT